MFVQFFFLLRDSGVPVTPTAFLRLHHALSSGLVRCLDDFYIGARAILVKSERYFDIYDRVFAHHFKGVELPDLSAVELEEAMKALLEEWLTNPDDLADLLGIDRDTLLEDVSPGASRIRPETAQRPRSLQQQQPMGRAETHGPGTHRVLS